MGLIKFINVELCGNQWLKNLDLAPKLASLIYLLTIRQAKSMGFAFQKNARTKSNKCF